MNESGAKDVAINAFLAELDDEQKRVFLEFCGKPECDEKMEDILVMSQWTMYENLRNGGYLKENGDADFERSSDDINNEDVEDFSSDVESDEFAKTEADQALESNIVDYTERMKDVTERLPSSLNILLLGETGVGKSTFINSIVNYLKDMSFPDAKKAKTEIVSPTDVGYTDEEGETHIIQVEPALDDNKSISMPDYLGITEYTIPINSAKALKFYDSAGFEGDPDAETDNPGFENALKLAKNGNIDCILVFLHPEKARLTPMLNIFLSKTMESCDVEKICFIFTHSQATNLRFGNTYSILSHFISRENIPIQDHSLRSFCYENNPLKFLWLLKNKNIQLEKSQERDLERNWNHSMEQTIKLLDRISTMTNEKQVEQPSSSVLEEVSKTDDVSKLLLPEPGSVPSIQVTEATTTSTTLFDNEETKDVSENLEAARGGHQEVQPDSSSNEGTVILPAERKIEPSNEQYNNPLLKRKLEKRPAPPPPRDADNLLDERKVVQPSLNEKSSGNHEPKNDIIPAVTEQPSIIVQEQPVAEIQPATPSDLCALYDQTGPKEKKSRLLRWARNILFCITCGICFGKFMLHIKVHISLPLLFHLFDVTDFIDDCETTL